MARSDVWLSLEQVQYRRDVLGEAAQQAYSACATLEANGVNMHLSLAISWTVRDAINRVVAVFTAAEKEALVRGGAPISPEFLDMFQLFHRVPAIRAEAVAWKTWRRRKMAESHEPPSGEGSSGP